MKEKVYAFLQTIPKGKVATYGQIAAYLGNKGLSRVVGNILHSNPDPEKVAKKFAFGGGAAQRKLLEQEGILFESNGSIDLEKYGI